MAAIPKDPTADIEMRTSHDSHAASSLPPEGVYRQILEPSERSNNLPDKTSMQSMFSQDEVTDVKGENNRVVLLNVNIFRTHLYIC